MKAIVHFLVSIHLQKTIGLPIVNSFMKPRKWSLQQNWKTCNFCHILEFTIKVLTTICSQIMKIDDMKYILK